jgi:hypothetical protein
MRAAASAQTRAEVERMAGAAAVNVVLLAVARRLRAMLGGQREAA